MLKHNSGDFRAFNGLGELSASMGKNDEAFKFFRKAIELHPYSSDVLNNIGKLFLQAHRREDALKCFQKALSFMPSHPDVHKNMVIMGSGLDT